MCEWVTEPESPPRQEAKAHGDRREPETETNRYGVGVAVLDWRDRLVCSRCGSRDIDMVLTAERR